MANGFLVQTSQTLTETFLYALDVLFNFNLNLWVQTVGLEKFKNGCSHTKLYKTVELLFSNESILKTIIGCHSVMNEVKVYYFILKIQIF